MVDIDIGNEKMRLHGINFKIPGSRRGGVAGEVAGGDKPVIGTIEE